MIKKAIIAGLLGLALTTGVAFGKDPGGTCNGDTCGVSDVVDVVKGYNIKLDVDVCLDLGNINTDDFYSTQATIYQEGDQNAARISQNSDNQLAAIIQLGDGNVGEITQTAASAFAIEIQHGNSNYASITQGLESTSAGIIQLGNGNSASIVQQ
jgi:hypothetical protein